MYRVRDRVTEGQRIGLETVLETVRVWVRDRVRDS